MATKSRTATVDLNSVFEGAASQFRGLNPNEPGQWPLLPKALTWTAVAIAMVIAIPIAYLVNNMWLKFFASRVSIGPAILLMNVLILTFISLIIVFSQSWRVSYANPIKSLRTEG